MAKRRSEADRRVRQSQRIGRALRLLCLIQERHGRWNLKALAQELDCSTKTVQRDLLALEEAKIPYFYDSKMCCYRVSPNFRLSILDDPSEQRHEIGTEPNATEDRQHLSAIEHAESSMEHAEQLLTEAERMVDALNRLCQSLRQSARASDDRGSKST